MRQQLAHGAEPGADLRDLRRRDVRCAAGAAGLGSCRVRRRARGARVVELPTPRSPQPQAIAADRADRDDPADPAVVPSGRHLRLRPRPEHRRVGAAPRAGTPGGHARVRHALRGDPRARRAEHHADQPAEREGDRHLRAERPRRRDVRAAFHLSRIPLHRSDRLSRGAAGWTPSRASSPTRHFRRPGRFVTSDAALNRLWQNIVWTQRANLYSVPTDCPQRDERMGWMGDAQVFWRTASYNMDMAAFGEKWLADVRDGQDAVRLLPQLRAQLPRRPQPAAPRAGPTRA